MSAADQCRFEIQTGERFGFGENWSRFLGELNPARVIQARESLLRSLGPLQGKTFLDLGCGSGLFSLAARQLGARVHSFDYDPESVGCALRLRGQFAPGDEDWTVERGSVLDRDYLARLGRFDVVYSWGVLHHTGAMWQALDNASALVSDGGQLLISIYNDQGKRSQRWIRVKRFYNRQSRPAKWVIERAACVQCWWRRWLKDLLLLRPFESWRREGQSRGMSAWSDLVDWVGGYPFEVAKPEEIFSFYRRRGFLLESMTTQGGDLGCNEFVFSKPLAAGVSLVQSGVDHTQPRVL